MSHAGSMLARAPRTLGAWAVAVASLAALVASLLPESPLAQREGFAEAVEFLRSSVGPDAFVVVWPPEHAAALERLPVELRAADAVPLEQSGRRRYLQVLVLGPTRFETPPELAAAAEERRRFGGVEVGSFAFASEDRVAFDLRSGIERAGVSLRLGQETLTCSAKRPEGGWACPSRPGWNHVARHTLVVQGKQWPCVWAHPASDGALMIEVPETELWDSVELEAALSDAAVAAPGGAAVMLLLEVPGVGVARLSRPNTEGVASVSLSTPRGTRAPLRIVITTAQDGRRHLGLNLRVIESR